MIDHSLLMLIFLESCGALSALNLQGTTLAPMITSSSGDATLGLWLEPPSAWCPDGGDTTPWVEIDMQMLYHVTDIDLQDDSTITRFSVSYAHNSSIFETYFSRPENSTVGKCTYSRIE